MYHIPLDRLGLLPQQIPRYNLDDERKNIIFHSSNDTRPVYAVTSNSDIDDDYLFENLKHLTGHEYFFSDIVLKEALNIVNTYKDMNLDWTRSGLEARRFSLHSRPPASITILHELTHSIAVPRLLTRHLSGSSWYSVMVEADRSHNNRMMRNPETLARVAFALSIPWYRWWSIDRHGYPDFHGIPRWNGIYDPKQTRYVDVVPPGILNGQRFLHNLPEIRRGPYAFAPPDA
ncbi:MAG: hypothetical protein M1813_001599 [Trichoglossum hirsutum]|nr:MAG: hypothetical protein M1813_001599 [Trichoglossum hirsutum]